MANTTQYKYSPRIFGKTGDQYLAMQPPGNGLGGANYMSPVEDVPVIDYGNGASAGTGTDQPPTGLDMQPVALQGSTPIEDFRNKEAAYQATLKQRAQLIAPERFAGSLPNPTTLPPPATYNTDPAVNTLLKLYPWLSLFGGVRGASAVTTGAAEGIGIHAQNEEQRLAQQRAYQQQAIDQQYQRDVKNTDLQAENNRYYNTAAGQFNTAAQAQQYHNVQGGQFALKTSEQELNRGRTAITKQIADIRHEIISGSVPWQRASQLMRQVEYLQGKLVTDYGGAEPGTAIDNLDSFQNDYYNKMKALDSKELSDQEKSIRYTNLQRELAHYNQTGRLTIQKNLIDYYNQRDTVEATRRESDKSSQDFRTNAEIWMKKVGVQKDYDTALQKAIQFNIQQKQSGRVTAYQTVKGQLDSLLTQQKTAQDTISKYEKIAQSGARGYEPSPEAENEIRQATTTLQVLQPLIESAQRRVNIVRDQLLVPPQAAPLPTNPMGGAGAPPSPPVHRGGAGNRDSGGPEASSQNRSIITTKATRKPIVLSPAAAAAARKKAAIGEAAGLP